jgi:DNA-binding MarR family transcriptional regulator
MAEFDNVIHQPVRLQIMSSLVVLDPGEQIDFAYLRNLLKLTDGNLGAHLNKLENAGYIKIDKTFIARKPRTLISATGKGRDAFDAHVAALNQILKGEAVHSLLDQHGDSGLRPDENRNHGRSDSSIIDKMTP